MKDIFEKQRVSPRHSFRENNARGGHVYFNIKDIKQHPSHARGRKRSGFPKLPEFLTGLRKETGGSRNASGWAQNVSRRASGTEQSSSGRSGFSRSPGGVIPFMASLFGMAMIALCSYFVINWEGYPQISVVPMDSGYSRTVLASYAGLNPSAAETVGEDAIPLDITETFSWETYTVKNGDSIYKIAELHSLSMGAVIAANGISNARRIQEGQKLRVPNMDGIPYTVKAGDNLARISAAHGVPLNAILDANDLESEIIRPGATIFLPGAKMRNEDLKLALGELFVNPVKGRLTSYFGWRNDPITGVRRFHNALDLAAPLGTQVKAAMDGKVSAIGNDPGLGKYIILNHPGGYQTLYAHLSSIAVVNGGNVIQGAKIGEVGNTGRSTGPHLHFAIYKNRRALNPLDFLTL